MIHTYDKGSGSAWIDQDPDLGEDEEEEGVLVGMRSLFFGTIERIQTPSFSLL